MTEIEKYQGIYASPMAARYGHSNHGAESRALIERWHPDSLLDVGCGFNEFVRDLRATMAGIRAVGVDFACPGADQLADVQALPFGGKAFDVLTSFDVLEHLREEEVQPALLEMNRVSQRFCFSISYVASVNKWQGQTLHPTVRPEDWWIRQIMRAGGYGITKWKRFIYGKWGLPLRMEPDDSVVLVGNGPGVLEEQNGPAIDAFDHIVRFNDFETAGFEQHVGARTTLWSSYFRNRDRKLRHEGAVICLHENDTPLPECKEIYRMPRWHYDRVRQAVQHRAWIESGLERDTGILLASSGLQIATYLLDVIGVRRVTLCGFDCFSKERSGQHHYWIPRAFGRPKEHDGDVEAAIIATLEKAGRIARL